ncbi:cytochrome b pre-mRNA-processing protein 3 [Caulobacter ginsengisoli]|uniref:Cytochrome b pre-mRNA-processing protein 3 n=1 Tax=Caulobacter ginsengisoli TaxID=400775 RepID=A0ABU0IP64_9CAUL|nr:ubiquinol-cytochrome C chaperone family protein [Caulobacter ginsengisoli]MDQ0463215.1 cytochrome b pre-mRNA-processing protein 3 [Caulobacter ginsengisoli]
MILDRLLKPRPAKAAGAALYQAAVSQARSPSLYAAGRVPDTREGRFELYTLHVILLVERLRGGGEAAAETSQALFNAYLRGLDDAFRELGVGDLAVPKRMKTLGEAFYGRGRSYEQAFDGLPDRTSLTALVSRTLLEGVEDAQVEVMADYVLAARQALEAQPDDALLAGQVAWAPAP